MCIIAARAPCSPTTFRGASPSAAFAGRAWRNLRGGQGALQSISQLRPRREAHPAQEGPPPWRRHCRRSPAGSAHGAIRGVRAHGAAAISVEPHPSPSVAHRTLMDSAGSRPLPVGPDRPSLDRVCPFGRWQSLAFARPGTPLQPLGIPAAGRRAGARPVVAPPARAPHVALAGRVVQWVRQ